MQRLDLENGIAMLTIPGVDPPGVACGLYRVEISKLVDGKETIPAIYNTETILGKDVMQVRTMIPEITLFNLTQ